MIDTDRIIQLENSLGDLKAQIATLGTLQVAMARLMGEALPEQRQKLTQMLEMMRQNLSDAGEHSSAGMLNGLIKDLKQQVGLPAND